MSTIWVAAESAKIINIAAVGRLSTVGHLVPESVRRMRPRWGGAEYLFKRLLSAVQNLQD